ncbi:hypothetical protein [Pseudaminobacter salicylatoxidans]|uniref:hypothetical protein n=1 Tax=Pseudaminobacter salicylatoxidans TaxID=93369 RepID=UPI00030BCCA5|nr:hypothetical protein [Pseudaminobacter salicylatoxidans]
MNALAFGGCLAACSLVGLAIGAWIGRPIQGLLIGFAAGAAIASVLIALDDRAN